MAKYQGNQTQNLEKELSDSPLDVATPSADPEEASFKKRYGDLRRHVQSVQSQKDDEIDRLKEQLESATKQQIRFPKTDAEIEEWSRRYPEVSKIIDTIARKRANEALEIGEKKIKSLEKMEGQIKRERAENELKALHPDFDRIRASKAFHDWVAVQPSWVQDALYKNSTDAHAAARAIDLFKSDAGIKKTKVNPKSAAQNVGRTGSSAPTGSGRAKFSESMVANMSDADYEKNEEAIMSAMRSGQFSYDLSGGAR
jgi:DNA repair exonuclease SbcCD ATPase subunit